MRGPTDLTLTTLENCTFLANISGAPVAEIARGGAALFSTKENLYMVNCLFARNEVAVLDPRVFLFQALGLGFGGFPIGLLLQELRRIELLPTLDPIGFPLELL